MARSFNKSQIDKLGEKLRHQDSPGTRELEFLQRVKADYEPAIASTQAILRDRLRLESSSRPKTATTIVEKLKREKTRLSAMQDIAGVRVVLPMTLGEQDALVQKIAGQFTGSRVVDRRAKPSHGYRAVHILAVVDDCPVEVQVRTHLQDLWAQIFEKLADRVGREIRYGGQPDLPAPIATQLASIVTRLQKISADIARVESIASRVMEPDDVSLVNRDLTLVEREMALLLEGVGLLRQ